MDRQQERQHDYLLLNSELNLYDADGNIQFDKDKEAARQYFLQHVNPNTVYFGDLEEKLSYLVENDYYEEEFLAQYRPQFIKQLFKRMYNVRYRFATFVGAYKFYTGYALKTFDGTRYLERYEDRIAVCALYLAQGDETLATRLADEIIANRYQPATPTFLNAGKKQRGELVSCMLVDIADDMNSIGRAVVTALGLSKRGAGVAFNLTNLRAAGDPIKKIENQAAGVIPVMKQLENCFSYANQLGARPGAGAVYLNAHHLDIEAFLDCRREAADEKIRIKTLSLGVTIPDITIELAKNDEDMYLFSPYDVARKYGKEFSDIEISKVYRELVDDPDIRKRKINARRFFQMIAETQFESGYPYILFEDNANRANNIAGRIKMSNLCVTGETEVLTTQGPRQARDLYESGERFDVIVDDRTRTWNRDTRGVSQARAIPMQLTARSAEIFKVTTKEGFELRATAWHKMYVERHGAIVKIPLADVIEGDRLLVQSGEGTFGMIDEPQLAYLAGILAGDGTFAAARNGEPTMRIDLYADKQQFVPAIERAAELAIAAHHHGPVHHSTTVTPKFRKESHGRRSLASAPLTRVLAERGVTKETKTTVPDFVKSGTKRTVLAFLEGLYQTDGSVAGSEKSKALSIELSSINRQMLVDVQRLLLNLGVFSRIYAVKGEGSSMLPNGQGGLASYSTQAVYSLRVMDRESRERLVSQITLREVNRAKFDQLTAGLQPLSRQPMHRFTARVESIVADGVEDVFDTTVEGVHSLIFNGLVTGNCSEILQVQEPSVINDDQTYAVLGKDISCNLGSLNISQVMDGPDAGSTVDTAIRALTAVSDMCDISVAPTIQAGNDRSHAVGLGAMNLHGYLAREGIMYGSEESIDFTDMFFGLIRYRAIWASTRMARERGETFDGFERSKYATGEAFDKYTRADRKPKTPQVAELFEQAGHALPTREDWLELAEHVAEWGLFHTVLLAVAPTGSISYVNHATASIHPITSIVETRKESKMGRVYYPAAHLTQDNIHLFRDAYDIGWKGVIDVYAAATEHVDQGLSLTLFFTDEATTRDLNRAQIYAHSKGIKTLYYVRVKTSIVEGTEDGCVSCAV